MRVSQKNYLLKCAGFSLIEIILALGVISFALVGILGLFPVAINAATDSQRETQATLIARSIFEQLSSQAGNAIRVINLNETLNEENGTSLSVDLTKDKTFGPMGFNVHGNPLPTPDDKLAIYQAEIDVFPLNPPEPGLTNVVVSITAINSAHARYSFACVVRRQ